MSGTLPRSATEESVPASTPGSGFRTVVKSVEYALRLYGRDLWLRKPETIIGRSPDCDIVIEMILVSRRHAKVTRFESCLMIEDLGSRSGVKVNSALIHRATEIRPGDHIDLGGAVMELVQSTEGEAPSETSETAR
jgi:predicted component of type VI protein secretion system